MYYFVGNYRKLEVSIPHSYLCTTRKGVQKLNHKWEPKREDRRLKNIDRSLPVLQKKTGSLNVLVWLHVPDKLRPSGAMGCLVESHRQAQVVNGSIMPLIVGLKWEQPTKERKSWYHKDSEKATL